MPGDTVAATLRTVIGQLAEASIRHNESLNIDTMNVGKPSESEPALSQPIIRIGIEQPLRDDREAIRLGSVSAKPTYQSDDYDGYATEEQLEETLVGYVVRVQLRTDDGRFEVPTFDIDYDSLGFVEFGESDRNLHDFEAHTDPIRFEEAVNLVQETMSLIREQREA